MAKKILLSSPHMSEQGYEKQYVQEAFDTNWIAPLGENVDNFEKELASIVDVKDTAALSSGTAALHLALQAANVEQGDIVICQSLTFAASANPIIYQGAIPVFVDSEYETWNMDPVYLRKALEKYPHAKAVIVVHLYGIPAKMDEIVSICKEYGVTLIEDAAESLGSFYKGVATGSIGDYGIFSFNGNKIITTSGGGALISKDVEKIDKIRFWATQSRDKARHYEHSELGFNYRMSNICAGIGRGQLKVLEERVAQKKAIFDFYKNSLKKYPSIQFMPENEWADGNYWLSCITLEEPMSPIEIIECLENEGIEARPLWKPLHLQPYFQEFDYFGSDVSQQLFEKGICLPSDTKMNDDDLARVVKVIEKKLNGD